MKRRFLYILCICLLAALAGCTPRPRHAATTAEEETAHADETQGLRFVGTIETIDTQHALITFVDVQTGFKYGLLYFGGVDLTNKYGDIIALAQLPIGEVCEVEYNPATNKLIRVHVSEQAMRYEDVADLQLDLVNNQVVLAGETLIFSDYVVIYDGEKLLKPEDLHEVDSVTVRAYDGVLCSITMSYGHGYVRLKNYDSFIGGMIEIGDVITEVTANMVLTVQEGTYELLITKGQHSGSKIVTVERDKEVEVDLADLEEEPDVLGEVQLVISPAGIEPKVYIDGLSADYESTLTLSYGRHSIVIKADGYLKYQAYFVVDQPKKVFRFVLTADGSGGSDTEDTTDSSTEEKDTSSEENDKTTEASTEEQAEHKITVETPVGVKLYVDGKYVGKTPCSFTKTKGRHIITLIREGCITATYTINITDLNSDETLRYEELQKFEDALDNLD